MFTRTHKAKPHMMFRLPFGSGALSFAEIEASYNEFVIAMDGLDMASCLSFYYEMNPVTSIYEFRDTDAEADVADAMGIDFGVCSDGESLSESQERKNIEKQKEVMRQRKAEVGHIKVVQNMWTCYQKASGDKKDAALKRLSSTFLSISNIESLPEELVSSIKIVISVPN